MKVKLSGTVHYANGSPVPNVVVRLYDKDISSRQDDDLTLVPGLSDDQGRFILTYEPLRYLDYHTIKLSKIPEEPFNLASSTPKLSLPDVGDFYLPYLNFSYEFNGHPRQHMTNLGIFQSRFFLPENPPVEFLPSQHGFGFSNDFSGYYLPFSMPVFFGSRKVSRKYGLCGGMCAAAYDFVLADRTIPKTNEIPRPGTRLYRYLFQRQMDSLGGLGQQALKVAQWTSLPDDTLLGTQARTMEEFTSLRQKLDDRNPVILALIYEYASSLKELSRRIFTNHQVLAFAYHLDNTGRSSINIYDPNFPGRDDVIIRSEPIALGEASSPNESKTLLGLRSTQLLGGTFYRQVRGFFIIPYQPVQPPKHI